MITLKPWSVYNEIEEYAADWLENLIAIGVIAPGVVDRRSIVDVRPDDYRGFRQCHFFAGIGVWSYALRRAGVSDDTPLWTGSCPCQPFSAAGQGAGVDDERHLWPHWFHLIRAARPPRIYGEQVATKDGLGWLDLVQADLEGEDYSIWTVDTCSAGSGAPHIRQRLRFCADDLRSAAGGMEHHIGARLEGFGNGHRTETGQREGPVRPVATTGGVEWVADHHHEQQRQGGDARGAGSEGLRIDLGRCRLGDGLAGSTIGQLADPLDGHIQESLGRPEGGDGPTAVDARTAPVRPGPTNGFWQDVDWLFCRDGKWRPVEPNTFPLVNGSAFHLGSGSAFEGKSRQGMLKGYGNAIDAEATVDFIEATLKPDTIEHEPMGDDPFDLLS